MGSRPGDRFCLKAALTSQESPRMHIITAGLGIFLIIFILWDAFETMVLPRRVTKKIRLARLFYRYSWAPWWTIAMRMKHPGRRENFLSFFGPLSLLFLIVIWAVVLVLGFALLHSSLGHLSDGGLSSEFFTDMYMSGTTFFTLGLGDITPRSGISRILTVVEAGMGFGFLALIISYLPVLYQAFSNREVNISLLDARAGSPPTAFELLKRANHDFESMSEFLRDWERWSAELLESQLSYPTLGFYRSQHSNQSWLTALVTILDACTLIIAGKIGPVHQARLTFAMARHALIDLAQVYGTPPRLMEEARLDTGMLSVIVMELKKAGFKIKENNNKIQIASDDLRMLYEPYAFSLSLLFLFKLPEWKAARPHHDNWQSHPWKEFLTLAESRKKQQRMFDHF